MYPGWMDRRETCTKTGDWKHMHDKRQDKPLPRADDHVKTNIKMISVTF